jgi:hypothetical protein
MAMELCTEIYLSYCMLWQQGNAFKSSYTSMYLLVYSYQNQRIEFGTTYLQICYMLI